jgi:hypothetical protein
MEPIALFLLRQFIQWINKNPDTPFSRYMLAPHGPNTDIKNMTRLDRLKSAISFFLWGLFIAAALLIVSYMTFGLEWFSAENKFVLAIIFVLFVSSAVSIVGSIYLLVRIIL